MSQRGQALIILIVAVSIALLVLSSTVLRALGQAKISSRSNLAQKVYYAAETGAEYGILKIMRNPPGCSGSENLTVDSANLVISYDIAGSNCQITSQATEQTITKKVQVEGFYDSNQVFQFCCWKEIP